jgi:hypothetical protein
MLTRSLRTITRPLSSAEYRAEPIITTAIIAMNIFANRCLGRARSIPEYRLLDVGMIPPAELIAIDHTTDEITVAFRYGMLDKINIPLNSYY